MKTFMVIVLFFIISAIEVLAQVAPSPVVAPIIPVLPPVVGFSLIAFVKANWQELCLVCYIVLDALIYFVPSLKANGLLQQLELWFKGQSSVAPPAA